MKVRDYSTRDFGREHYSGARSVLIPSKPFALFRDRSKYEAHLRKVRQKLPTGYIAFLGTSNQLGKHQEKGVELVVAPGKNQLDILEIAGTDAINYGMLTDDLVARLKDWDTKYGIDIWQAETDTIQLKLSKLPKDVKAFANEVYKFCPDIVNQGIGTVSALEEEIRKSKEVYLWWD